ncbi:MAG: 2-oxo acid dehydrogenase subunit E2 [Chloroflexota bacterium]|nr:2-oxo acid dehydrogenase subunit E2 [Chloroflexota bacterium]
MISEVVMPQMGADMTEGTILRWLKHEGDPVARGEIIAEIETDKANVEIEAFEGGTFRKTLASEGDVIPVGGVIAVIAAPEDDVSKYEGATMPPQAAPGAKAPTPTAEAAPATTPPATASAARPSSSQSTASGERPPVPTPPAEVRKPRPVAPERSNGAGERLRVSPVARRIADERGIDLHQVHGSGPDGRIIRRDVESLAKGAPQSAQPAPPALSPTESGERRSAAAPPQPMTMSKMRQTIARRMSQSKREAPHYYLLIDIDMTDAAAFRAQANESLPENQHLSVNDLLVKASALALQSHPMFNVTMMDGGTPEQHAEPNICIGIALDDGLIAPALLDAGRKPLSQLAREAKDLIARAKGGSLRPDEVNAGTFTISNLGAYGVESLIAIIQPPQTAILGVGALTEQPVVRGGVVVVRQMMIVALSADHRVTDGAQGAQFLAEIRRLLEHPLLLVL